MDQSVLTCGQCEQKCGLSLIFFFLVYACHGSIYEHWSSSGTSLMKFLNIDHFGCLVNRHAAKLESYPKGNWFCSKICKKV